MITTTTNDRNECISASPQTSNKSFREGTVEDIAKYWYGISTAYVDFFGETLEISELFANGKQEFYRVKFAKYPGSTADLPYTKACWYKF